MLQTYLKWFVAHERILIIFAVLLVAGLGFNKWLNVSAKNADARAVAAEQLAKETRDRNDQLALQIAQQTRVYQQGEVARIQAMTTLLDAVSARDRASQTKITTVTGPKTPPAAVADLESVYNLPVSVVPTDIGAVVPTPDLQVFTVTKIEHDTLASDLKDQKSISNAQSSSLTEANVLISSLQGQVTGLNAEVKVDDAACQLEIKAVKATARKGKRNFFIAGFMAGLATRFLAKW